MQLVWIRDDSSALLVACIAPSSWLLAAASPDASNQSSQDNQIHRFKSFVLVLTLRPPLHNFPNEVEPVVDA